MPKLSAILITFNEELDLPDCLASLKKLHDDMEIIVVDNNSTDATRDIAQAAGAKVILRTFDNYASQRQASLEAAQGDWALWIDADERVTPQLHRDITEVLSSPPADIAGFDIPFAVYFMGRKLRFGGLGSEHHVRLFRRESARFTGGALHETIEISGTIAPLSGQMQHIPYRDLNDYLGKLPDYTSKAAAKRFAAGRRFSLLDYFRPPWEFVMRVFLKGGLLDGAPGLMWAGLAAMHTWIKYAKLRELGRHP